MSTQKKMGTGSLNRSPLISEAPVQFSVLPLDYLLRVSGALREICWQAEAGEMLGFQVAIDATEADWFQEAEIPLPFLLARNTSSEPRTRRNQERDVEVENRHESNARQEAVFEDTPQAIQAQAQDQEERPDLH
jgi:hypothetical protein